VTDLADSFGISGAAPSALSNAAKIEALDTSP
jgi:hypothetical protein